jgi:hypothetical protein
MPRSYGTFTAFTYTRHNGSDDVEQIEITATFF